MSIVTNTMSPSSSTAPNDSSKRPTNLRWLIASECFVLNQLLSSHSNQKIPPEIITRLQEIHDSLNSDPTFQEQLFIDVIGDLLRCGEASANIVSYILSSIDKLHPFIEFPRSMLVECKFTGSEKSDELVLVKLLNSIRLIDGSFDQQTFDFACRLANGEMYGEALRLTSECFLEDFLRNVQDKTIVLNAASQKLETGDCSVALTGCLFRIMSQTMSSSLGKNALSAALKVAFRYMMSSTVSMTPHAINLLMSAFTQIEIANQFIQHFEWLISLLTDLINDTDQKHAVLREYAIECISQLSLSIPNLMVSLYVNYECVAGYPDTLDCLINALLPLFTFSREQKSKREGPIGLKAAQAVINLIKSIEKPESALTLEQRSLLQKTFEQKSLIEEVVKKFNKDPKSGVIHALENGLLQSTSAEHVAHFLRSTPGLDKKFLGEYLVKYQPVLSAFMADFKFESGTRIDEAVRLALESFRLPGEGQQIDRVMETFASVYYGSVKDHPDCPFKDQDGAFVLAFSIIMLNTDQHNPQIKNRMTFEQFVRNNRGINGGGDFNLEYLKSIYDAIKSNAIILPSEHTGEAVIDFKWNEVSQRGESNVMDVSCYGAMVLEKIHKCISDCCLSVMNQQNQRYVTDQQLALALKCFEVLALALSRAQCVDQWEYLISEGFKASNYASYSTSKSGNALPKYLSRVITFQNTLECLLSTIKDSELICSAFYDFLSCLLDCALVTVEDIIPKEESIEADLPKTAHRPSSPSDSEGFLSSITSYWRSSASSTSAVIEPDSVPTARQFVHDKLLSSIRNIISTAAYTYTSDKPSFVRFALELQYWQSIKSPHIDDFPGIFPQLLTNPKDTNVSDSGRTLTELALVALTKVALKHTHLLPRALQVLTAQPSNIFKAVIDYVSRILTEHFSKTQDFQSDIWPALFAFLALFESGKQDPVHFISLLGSLLRPSSVVIPEVFFTQYLDLWSKHIKHSPEMVTGAWTLLDTAIRRAGLASNDFLIPLHWSIARCCTEKDRTSRHAAFTCLQKLLTNVGDSTSQSQDYSEVDSVLLPLIDELIESKADHSTESLMRVIAMLTRLTLQSLSFDPSSIWYPTNPSFISDYWPMLIESFEKLSTFNDILREAVEESIRNLLLVMKTQFSDIPEEFWTDINNKLVEKNLMGTEDKQSAPIHESDTTTSEHSLPMPSSIDLAPPGVITPTFYV